MSEASEMVHVVESINRLKEQAEKPIERPVKRQVTDCDCTDKSEEWNFDHSLGCWYVERECERCEYYWEGPFFLYDDPNQLGNTLE